MRQIKPPQPGKPNRPIVTAEHRAEVLAALKSVDAVVIFDEPTLVILSSRLQPEIYVKGGDYTTANLPEAPTVQAYGGQINSSKSKSPPPLPRSFKRLCQLTIDN